MAFNRNLVILFIVTTMPGFILAMEIQKSNSALHFYGVHRRSQSQVQKKVSIHPEVEKKYKDTCEKFEKAFDFLSLDREMSLEKSLHCCLVLRNTTTILLEHSLKETFPHLYKIHAHDLAITKWLELSLKETFPHIHARFSAILEKTDTCMNELTASPDMEDVD